MTSEKATKTTLRRKVGAVLVLMAAVVLVLMYVWMPGWVMRHYNRTVSPAPYTVSAASSASYASTFVADMHCDALMWPRNLAERGIAGHVDIPRLLEGNVAVEFFYTVNRVPLQMKPDGNSPGLDVLGVYNFFQGWPLTTWYSPRARTLHMAGLLEKAVQQSGGSLCLLRTSSDLQRFMTLRAKNPRLAAAILGAEGLYCMENDLENIRVFYNAGFRVLGLAHFYDNELAASAQGLSKGGLTTFGKQALDLMERLKITPDLAHASERTIDDVLAAANRPVLVSHTGLRGISDSLRNLSDAQAKRIAEKGGIIGVGFWDAAVGAPDVPHIVKSIRYAVNLLGAEHVALGSDFDGATTTPFDVTGLPTLFEGLLKAGFSAPEIEGIMGGNVQRFLLENLPADSDTSTPATN